MKNKNLSIAITYEVDSTFDSDKFLKMKLKVMHDNENRNGSFFIAEGIEKAKSSIQNIPILANVIFNEDGEPQFSSHDMHIEKDNNGASRLIYDETPIGIVPESSSYEFKQDSESGLSYVYVDAFIWKGYANYAEDIINRDKEINLSMEISVDDGYYDAEKKVYIISNYRYLGITFLGNDKTTGMIDAKAKIEAFASSEYKEKISTIVEELNTCLHEKRNKEGGQTMENTNFQQFVIGYRQLLEVLRESLYVYNDENNYYSLLDFTSTDILVKRYYYEIDNDNYIERTQLLQMPYIFDGTKTAINMNATIELFSKLLTKEELEKVNEERTTLQQELMDLRTFKENRIKEVRNEQVGELFDSFDSLLGNDAEFIALKSNNEEFTIEEIENICFSLIGKKNFQKTKPKADEKFIKVEVTKDEEDDSEDNYGGLLSSKY